MLPLSELWELRLVLWRLSELLVDRLPSLVLLLNDSILPPLLLVAILSVLEYPTLRLPVRSLNSKSPDSLRGRSASPSAS